MSMSTRNKVVGIGATIRTIRVDETPGETTKSGMRLGTRDTQNPLTVELAAISRALGMLARVPHATGYKPRSSDIIILTRNEAAMQASTNPGNKQDRKTYDRFTALLAACKARGRLFASAGYPQTLTHRRSGQQRGKPNTMPTPRRQRYANHTCAQSEPPVFGAFAPCP